MQIISSALAAAPFGHYAQAVSYGGIIYVSSQLAVDPAKPDAPPGSVADQTQRALNNVSEILRAGGSDFGDVLKVMIYLSDIAHWDAVNAVYARSFGDHRPARGVLPVGKLHKGYDVAFDVIAKVAHDD